MDVRNSKTKKIGNFQKENEINKGEKKIYNEKKKLNIEEEKRKLEKDLKPKNRKEEDEEREEDDEFGEEKEEDKKGKEEDIIYKNENEAKHLEIKFKIQLNKEKDEIYKVYELSDNRIAVELEKSIKIYSLKTFHLLTEINHDNNNNSMELKNKDIAITCYRIVYFYKLSGNNYINYLQLEEKNKKRIYEIYELKNDNLILCFRSDLEIYKKEKEEYKFLTKFELNETV